MFAGSRLRSALTDLIDYGVVPAGAAVPPWRIGHRCLDWLAGIGPLLDGISAQALANARRHLSIDDPAAWRRRFKAVLLADRADLYLSRWRRGPNLVRRYLDVRGDWPGSGALALGMHYGTGMWLLEWLRLAGRRPVFLYRGVDGELPRQRPVFARYLKQRAAQVHRLGRGAGISTGGGYRRVLEHLAAGDTVIALADVPHGGGRAVPVELMGQRAWLRGGIFNLAAEARVPVVAWRLTLAPQGPRRRLTVSVPLSAPLSVPDPGALAQGFADFMNASIAEDSASWGGWPGPLEPYFSPPTT